MPVKEDGELHAWQAILQCGTWFWKVGEGYRRKTLEKIEQDSKGFTVQNVIKIWFVFIYLFIYFSIFYMSKPHKPVFGFS